jgi:hypothetical protein
VSQKRPEILLFEATRIVVQELVDSDNVIVFAQQFLRQMGANEAGNACD